MTEKLVVVRGSGDIAAGTIYKLTRCGFHVLALDIPKPTVIRRTVAFAQAVIDGQTRVEDQTAVLVRNIEEMEAVFQKEQVAVAVDQEGHWIERLHPVSVVDAILAKKNLGTTRSMAPIVVGLGPGFTAGEDVDAVIETNRGHDLGRVILQGCAQPNTGIPGVISGYGAERVVRAPTDGTIHCVHTICDHVTKGEILAYVGDVPVRAPLTGVLRGMIGDGAAVTPGFKIGDVDPRDNPDYCFGISDKARAIAGGVLEAILYLRLHPPHR